MRIWSLHPRHLDTKGLVALWRETLLAKHVLEGKTKGYRNHPQLNRFKASKDPLASINQYLAVVYKEAHKRGYNFDRNKINWYFEPLKLPVNRGQVEFETSHLLNKLETRDKEKYREIMQLKRLALHPMFRIRAGGIESWEVLT